MQQKTQFLCKITIVNELENDVKKKLQSLLTHVSRATKQMLNKLGVFTVSSFHAFICARSPSLLNNLLAGRGATKRRPPLLSRSNSGSSRRSLQISTDRPDEKPVKVIVPENQVSKLTSKTTWRWTFFSNLISIYPAGVGLSARRYDG